MTKSKTKKQVATKATTVRDSQYFSGIRGYLLLVSAFSFLLYFNTVFNGYNMDDELVTQNHRLTSKGISVIPEIFSSPYYQDDAGYKYEYRPVTLSTFAIEISVFGEHAAISHFINAVLYAQLCALLFFVLQAIFSQYNILFPLLITLLFAAHPTHTEVVASIKNRDEILALFFGLLSLHAGLRYARKKQIIAIPAMVIFFVLGILSKTTVITFALLIPLTLMFFTEINFVRIMAVAVSLAIPAVLFSRLFSVSQQVILFLVMLLGVVLLYGAKNFAWNGSTFRNLASGLLSTASIEKETTESKIDFAFLKNVRTILFIFFPVILAFAISVTGVYYGYLWLIVAPLFLFAIAFSLGSIEMKWLLLTPISLISTFTLVKMGADSTVIEMLLAIFLSVFALHANKTIRITAIINLSIYAVLLAFCNHSYYILVLVFFVGIYFAQTFRITVAVLLGLLVFFAKALYEYVTPTHTLAMILVNLPVLYLALYLFKRNKTKWLTSGATLMIPVLVIVYFSMHPYLQKDLSNNFQQGYYQLNTVKAIDATPVQAVRPLGYVELPVTSTSPVDIRLGTAFVVLLHYLKLMLIPYPLSFYYGYSYIVPEKISASIPLLSLALHLLLATIALLFYRKQPVISFSILFYLIAISVFSGLAIPVPGMMADRFLLIPSLGFCILLVYLLFKLFKQDFIKPTVRWKELTQPLKISLGIFLVLYSLLTFSRNADWKDRLTLFRTDIHKVENSAQAQNLLALHLFIASNHETDAIKQKQLREEALPHFNRALEIYPQFLNASFDRARLLDALKRYDEALVAYRQTTSIDTAFGTPYFPMGVIYQNQKKYTDAVSCYEKFIAHRPDYMQAYANLSYAYFQAQQYEKSIAVNQRALIINPAAFDPVVNIAITYKQMGVKDSALVYYEKARLIRPDYPNIDNTIAALKSSP